MDYTVLYETFQYWKQYAWIFVKNEILPELKYRVAMLKRRNDRNEKEEKRIALLPSFMRPYKISPLNFDEWAEEKERIAYDRYEAHFSNQN